MIIEQDGFRFDFGQTPAFVFDEKDRNSERHHEGVMKAVDLIIDLPDRYYFVELKDYSNKAIFQENLNDRMQTPQEHVNWLKGNLKYKFRDTFLYRFAEGFIGKDIYYICLIDCDAALLGSLAKDLRRELPVPRQKRWKTSIAKNCFVINPAVWNSQFPDWRVEKIAKD